MLRRDDNFSQLLDVDSEPFATWEDFVQYREPFGLGMRVEVANAVLAERDTTRLLSDVVAAVPDLAPQEYGAGKPGPGRGHKTIGGANRLSAGGTTATYLAARLKRDHPDIAARIDDFPSMRAAARAAGIIRERTTVDIVRSAWKRATQQEREEIAAWIDVQMSALAGSAFK